MTTETSRQGSLMTDYDLYLFNEGRHRRLAEKMGAHPVYEADTAWRAGDLPPPTGATFAVWAPSARSVSVVGDFNDWRCGADVLDVRGSSGIWDGYVAAAEPGHVYKYEITGADGVRRLKADPFAFWCEVSPRTGSVVCDLHYRWGDGAWMADRAARIALDAPVSIYELHLGSWLRAPDDPNRLLSYREVAPKLVEYVSALGFTHVELLPVMEHPFYGSWGYQTTGYFAPSSRYGTPQDFMAFVDELHDGGVGVLLDWVPSHFPDDDFGLARFDGTHLYEHADPRLGVHPDWNSLVFNYGRHEVRSFLSSSAEHWLSTYHADGIRVDAVASMLYRDYSRRPGEWVPNEFGGNANLEAIGFLRELNAGIYEDHPDVHTAAEESTAWPGVSRPIDTGGLGFGYKWDMGWMHDTLRFFAKDPVHRRHHLGDLAFRNVYAFSENFVLPLSHDEVVHGKRSLLAKMPGDRWQRFANLRLLLAYQWTTPGKKLLFMGDEFGQVREWDHDRSLDWHVARDEGHAGINRLVGDLNLIYRTERALHASDCDPEGFAWIEAGDRETSTMSFVRLSGGGRPVVVVCNFTPVPRDNLTVGVPEGGDWVELLNTDAAEYGGSGIGNLGRVRSRPLPWHNWPCLLVLHAPPLACVILAPGASDDSGDTRPS